MVKKEWKKSVIRIGTRKSELAKIQTGLVVSKLQEAFPEYEYEIVYMTTRGDKEKESPIPSFGGKAVFVEEFEQALLDDTIDLAVHSAKDMPNPCKDGLTVAGVLERACVQDPLQRILFLPLEQGVCADSARLKRCIRMPSAKVFEEISARDLINYGQASTMRLCWRLPELGGRVLTTIRILFTSIFL